MGVSAQVSFYTLGGSDLAGAIDRFVAVLDESGLPYEVGSMSTVIWGDLETVFTALREAYERASEGNDAVMTVTVSNACPVPQRAGGRA